MADLLFDYGLDLWATWTTDTFRFMAMKSSYNPSQTSSIVAQLVANECTASGYARATAAGKSRTVDTSNHRITYDCSDPNLGAAAAGETIGGFVLFKFVTNDNDSIPMAYYDVIDFATDGSPIVPVINVNGAHYIDQA